MLTSPEFLIHSPLEVGSERDFSLKSGPVAASDGMHGTLTQVVNGRKERLEHSEESWGKKEAYGNDESPQTYPFKDRPLKAQIQAKSPSEVCSADL